MKKVLISLIILLFVIAVYIGVGFYNIEHTYSNNGNLLMTKQQTLSDCLDANLSSFNNIVDLILAENSDLHDYYLEDMIKDDDDVITLLCKCNVEWIRVGADRKSIIFYQTSQSREKDDIILSYMCSIGFSGEKVWSITDYYPDHNNKETLSVKLYNILFNSRVK